jgi:hypothetical protein
MVAMSLNCGLLSLDIGALAQRVWGWHALSGPAQPPKSPLHCVTN